MARSTRIDLPNYPQHLILRGNNRCVIFQEDVDRYVFLKSLEESAKRYACCIHAYVLMDNHVHFLATPREQGAISRMVQSIGRRFVRFVNDYRRRTGTLFEGRFKSSLVETDRYFLTCMRYIEMNPVRAGMVSRPSEHPWSSFRANASGGPEMPLVAHPVYLALGPTPTARGAAYRRLFEKPILDEDLAAIRKSANRSRVLGSDDFEQWVESECDSL